MVKTTMTSITTRIPQGWLDDVILAARHEMVMPKLVSTDYKWNKKMGDTINIRRMFNWDAGTKVHGTDYTATAFEEYETQKIIIDQFSAALRHMEDVAEIFVDDAYNTQTKQGMAYALNRLVEVALTGLFNDLSQQGPGTSLGTEVTWPKLVDANRVLRSVSINADRDNVALVISAEQEAAFKKQDQFMNSLTAGAAGPSRLERATIGTQSFLGAKVVQSNLLNAPAAGQHDMALFDKRCFALVYAKKPEWVEVRDGPGFATYGGMLQAFGRAIISRYSETPGNITPVDNFGVFLPGV